MHGRNDGHGSIRIEAMSCTFIQSFCIYQDLICYFSYFLSYFLALNAEIMHFYLGLKKVIDRQKYR